MPASPQNDPARMMADLMNLWRTALAPLPPTQTEQESPAERLMAQALAVANMPSRGEIGDLAARIDRIEESLARIERLLEARPAKAKSRRKKRDGPDAAER